MNTLTGGRGWIRTTEGNNRQIYSLFPLATRELSHIDAMHCGAGGRTRTPDLLITNQLLYQLSYTSIFVNKGLTLANFSALKYYNTIANLSQYFFAN